MTRITRYAQARHMSSVEALRELVWRALEADAP